MQLKINKEAFFEVEGISILKSHVDKISKNSFDGKCLSGVIDINISYIDTVNDECFKALTLDFEIEMDNIKVNNIKLANTKVFVIESHGINVEYELELDYEAIDEANEELEEAFDNEIVLDENDIEKIKENIEKDYENKLLDSLNSRDASNVEIIKTKDKRSENEFLSFFTSKESSYYSLKTIHCPNEDALNEISKKYNISIDELIKGYDRITGRVTFRYND